MWGMDEIGCLRDVISASKAANDYFYYTEHIHFPPAPQILVEPELLYDCVYCVEAPTVFSEIARKEGILLGPKFETKEDYEDARQGTYTAKRYVAPTEREIKTWLRQNLGKNYDALF